MYMLMDDAKGMGMEAGGRLEHAFNPNYYDLAGRL